MSLDVATSEHTSGYCACKPEAHQGACRQHAQDVRIRLASFACSRMQGRFVADGGCMRDWRVPGSGASSAAGGSRAIAEEPTGSQQDRQGVASPRGLNWSTSPFESNRTSGTPLPSSTLNRPTAQHCATPHLVHGRPTVPMNSEARRDVEPGASREDESTEQFVRPSRGE